MFKVARNALVFTAALATCGTMSTKVLADGTTGSIYGRVYAQGSHRPVSGLVVHIESNREAPQETLTRPDGSFSFAAVFPGEVAVTIGRQVTPVDVHANLESDETFVVSNATVATAP